MRQKNKRRKNLKSFVISHILCTFTPDKEPLKQAGVSESGILWSNASYYEKIYTSQEVSC